MLMAESWLVLKCPACKNCHGRKGTGHLCPHCGQRIASNTEVIDTAKDSNELRTKVILANTPDELRDLLESKLLGNQPLVDNEISSYNLLKLVKSTADDQGFVSREIVQKKILEMGNGLEVDSIMEEIESQGLIIRIDSGIWQFLE
tara:strand:+ start:154 stop:591 length:438 start_codon:yes stop_codon:yes gene_type:complete